MGEQPADSPAALLRDRANPACWTWASPEPEWRTGRSMNRARAGCGTRRAPRRNGSVATIDVSRGRKAVYHAGRIQLLRPLYER